MTVVNISGHDVMLDDEDVERVVVLKWCVDRYAVKKRGQCYFKHTINYIKNDGKGHTCKQMVHRFIMGCIPGDGKVVDHIDGNTLNNQKSNLRICTMAENSRNRKRNKNNTSGYKGVSYSAQRKKWQAQIRVDGGIEYLGLFADPTSAHEAYKEAALKYHGEFARFE
jgi:hypothetical protein